MLMVSDVPESLLMSYENLAAEISVAEAQKDLLSQFLRHRFPTALSIAESGESVLSASEMFSVDKSGSSRSRKLTLKCFSCGGNDVSYKLDSNSIRLENVRGNDRFHASFKTVSSQGRNELWRVAVMPDDSGFCLRSILGVSPAQTLKAEDFQIVPCRKDSQTGRAAFFESVSAARLRIEAVRGLRFSQHVGQGSFLSDEQLSGVLAVKAYDRVRVVLDGSSDLQIKTLGRALQSAQKGQTVKVELEKLPGVSRSSGKRTIDAIVVAPGEVAYVR
jgi:hypothetical protein